MTRKFDMGNDAGKPTPKPVFLITDNEGSEGEQAIQHIYAPTTSTQRTTLAGLIGDDLVPIGSTTNDVTSGKAYVLGAADWELVTSV